MKTHIITQNHSIQIDSDKVESITLGNDLTIVKLTNDAGKSHITCYVNYHRVGNIIILDKLVYIEFIS